MDPRRVVESLGPHHDRAAFVCGVPALDRYLRQQAGQDLRNNLAAVFVLADGDGRTILGYYTLSATAIEATALPEATTKRLARYPLLPAVLLGRLAVAIAAQGQGLGAFLLIDALKRGYRAREQVGAMAVVVDALGEDARAFYEGFGFRRFPDHEFRLFMEMGRIALLP
jgi:GNAT superfamily N-acetyltransferase